MQLPFEPEYHRFQWHVVQMIFSLRLRLVGFLNGSHRYRVFAGPFRLLAAIRAGRKGCE